MEIKIENTEKNYDFKPTSTAAEITQNLENIISRVQGTIPLARHKGVIVTNIDLPQSIIQAQLLAAIDEEITREEDRFTLDEAEINFEKSINGGITCSLKGGVNE